MIEKRKHIGKFNQDFMADSQKVLSFRHFNIFPTIAVSRKCKDVEGSHIHFFFFVTPSVIDRIK